MTKTNAVRLLDTMQIAYELRAYEVDLEDLSAPTVAAKINLPVEQVFKTLVTIAPTGEHVFAVLPGDQELDLKKLAAISEQKSLALAPLKQVEPLTGYVRGAVTVLAARKHFPVFVDETMQLYNVISVSAGQRGLQLLLAPKDYLEATTGLLADITK